jgi:hypothetical protein
VVNLLDTSVFPILQLTSLIGSEFFPGPAFKVLNELYYKEGMEEIDVGIAFVGVICQVHRQVDKVKPAFLSLLNLAQQVALLEPIRQVFNHN